MQKGLLGSLQRVLATDTASISPGIGGTLMPHNKQYFGNAKGCWSEAMAFG